MTLGTGEWKVYLTEQGGGQPIAEVPWTGISINPAIDNSATCSVTIGEAGRSEIRRIARPWEHEVIVYRNRSVPFVGPLVIPAGNTLQCQDLSYWMEVRLITKDLFVYGDSSTAFGKVFGYAYGKDPRPNIKLNLNPSGVPIIHRYKGADTQKAIDALRELARMALDYTTKERTIYVGGSEVFAPQNNPAPAIVLHDGALAQRATVTRDGSKFGTDFRVFAGRQGRDGKTRAKPLIGRSIGDTGRSGLIERVATELQIQDLTTANANARARRLASEPLSVSAKLGPAAGFDFDDLICGRRVDVRLSADAADEQVTQVMRLVGFPMQVSPEGEDITLNLATISVEENDT